MTNPADVLTDEFNERVAGQAVQRAMHAYGLRSHLAIGAEAGARSALHTAIVAQLRAEREPIHELTFEVRAETREAALKRLLDGIERNCLWSQEGIHLRDEP